MTDFDLLSSIEKDLLIKFPEMKAFPEPWKQILTICFAPMTRPYHSIKHTKLHFQLVMKLPYIKMLLVRMKQLEEIVIKDEEDKHFVKPRTWTKEDEQQRLE